MQKQQKISNKGHPPTRQGKLKKECCLNMELMLAVITGCKSTKRLQISKMCKRTGLGEGQSGRDQKVI